MFKTICRKSINIEELPGLGIWQRSMLIVFDHCLQESEAGGQTLWKSYYHITCLICLFNSFKLALSFAFSKTKMFKVLFILFVMKQLLGNVKSVLIFILPIKQTEKLHTWSILIFTCIYFCELKNFISWVFIFCECQVFENFNFMNLNPIEKRIRKKTVDSRDMRLIFLPRSMERQTLLLIYSFKKN